MGSLWLGARHRPDDVAVPGVGDGEGADPEVLAARSAELIVVAGVVVNASLSQHGVVLDLGLAERRGVVGDDHQLGLSTPAIDRFVSTEQLRDARGEKDKENIVLNKNSARKCKPKAQYFKKI